MPILHRSPAVTLGSIARQVLAAVVTTFALCTPALAENARVGMEGVLVTFRDAANREPVIDANSRHAVAQTAAAQTAAGRAPARRRLGRWATIPGTIFGAMLGGAVDCLVTRCQAQVPNGVWVGMFTGMSITAFAPRRVAGTFLGVGGGIVAGTLIGSAIEGDCRPDHPCTKSCSPSSIGGGRTSSASAQIAVTTRCSFASTRGGARVHDPGRANSIDVTS